MSRLNTASLNYFNAFSLPTLTDRVLQNHYVQNSSTTKLNTFDIRLDWNASPNNLFFFRFSHDNSTSNNESELPQQTGQPPFSANGAENFGRGRGYDLGYTPFLLGLLMKRASHTTATTTDLLHRITGSMLVRH
jgi:hypothetical protein